MSYRSLAIAAIALSVLAPARQYSFGVEAAGRGKPMILMLDYPNAFFGAVDEFIDFPPSKIVER